MKTKLLILVAIVGLGFVASSLQAHCGSCGAMVTKKETYLMCQGKCHKHKHSYEKKWQHSHKKHNNPRLEVK